MTLDFLEPTLAFREDPSVLSLSGNVIYNTVEKIWRLGLEEIKKRKGPLLLDLGELKQCDSSVLALLSSWGRAAYQEKKKLDFINTPDFLKDLLKVYGLKEVLMTS